MMDALLRRCPGDIQRISPTDQWKSADSLELLEQVVALVRDRGWAVTNLDAVVIAERPKLRLSSRRCAPTSPPG